MPPIVLDTTLKGLYDLDSSYGPRGQIAMVLCAASSEIAPTAKLVRNSKYLYQDSTFSSTSLHVSSEEHAKLRRAVAVKYLSLVPQHDAFAAGNMPVILFDPQGSSKDTARGEEEATRTMSILTQEQRPKMLFFAGPADISMAANGIDLLVAKMELDELEGFPCAIDLDTHYFLNTKAALCTSGLPSPRSVLVELEGFGAMAQDCCPTCVSHADKLFIPENCSGVRRRWLNDQIDKMLARVSAQPLPFVLKNQQTFGGGGTFMVSSPEELSTLTQTLRTQILPKLLSEVDASNAHLKPATLILSEMVTDPIGDWGLTFFVTRSGKCVFLAATEQIVDSAKAWIGSKISYLAQDDLKHRFTPLMENVGTWLHGYGYYGPCGADILETLAHTTDYREERSATTMKIVDLNVRTSGSLVLGLLKGHLSARRDLHEASSFSVTVKMGREAFIERLADEYRDGRLVIVSWFEDLESGLSYGNVVVGAPHAEALEKEVAKIKSLASEIHF
ncbi:MAG: hypothetical protein Q9207_005513 [Kuettlingeria erythrocarpa]